MVRSQVLRFHCNGKISEEVINFRVHDMLSKLQQLYNPNLEIIHEHDEITFYGDVSETKIPEPTLHVFPLPENIESNIHGEVFVARKHGEHFSDLTIDHYNRWFSRVLHLKTSGLEQNEEEYHSSSEDEEEITATEKDIF